MTIADHPIALIPAYNEAATVGAIVAQVRALWNCPVTVIDDCSTDATPQIARSAGATVLPLTIQLGTWGAMQTGPALRPAPRLPHGDHPRRRRSARTGKHWRAARTPR